MTKAEATNIAAGLKCKTMYNGKERKMYVYGQNSASAVLNIRMSYTSFEVVQYDPIEHYSYNLENKPYL